MDFIRRQRNSPNHDANTRHCLCGADADLIMLGLATHEPYFTIVREEFKPNQPKPCDLCGQLGHEMSDCVGAAREDNESTSLQSVSSDPEFIFIRLNILRQYLCEDLKLTGITFDWNLERAIDDWVFMCFFAGNDFLPHLPSLEIREGAIDRLVDIYKSTIQKTGGWLTEDGKVNLDRVQLILIDLSKMEDEVFKKRRDSELQFRERKHRNSSRMYQAPNSGLLAPTLLSGRDASSPFRQVSPSVSAEQVKCARRLYDTSRTVNWHDQNLNNLEASIALKAVLRPHLSQHRIAFKERSESSDDGPSPTKVLKLSEKGHNGHPGGSAGYSYDDEVADAADDVCLWEEGWRSRYYQSKFGVDPNDSPDFCIKVGHEYVRGLCWVLAYYYQGCVSWDWYFPFHYAPFACDFQNIATVVIDFDKPTEPFRPLEQLMGVFPADSRENVPPAWQDLMVDPDSPIIDFYPIDFKVDLNGKKFLWMGVALLPFVDEVRLLKVLDSRRHLLTEEEKERNARGSDQLFCHIDHPTGHLLQSVYVRSSNNMEDASQNLSKSVLSLDPKLSHGISGQFWPSKTAYLPGTRISNTLPQLLPDLTVRTVCVNYADPVYPKGFIFRAKLLDSVRLPPPVHLLPPEKRRGRGFANSHFTNDRRITNSALLAHYTRDDRARNGQHSSRMQSAAERMILSSIDRYDLRRPAPYVSNDRAMGNQQYFIPPRPAYVHNPRDTMPSFPHNSQFYFQEYTLHPPQYSTELSQFPQRMHHNVRHRGPPRGRHF